MTYKSQSVRRLTILIVWNFLPVAQRAESHHSKKECKMYMLVTTDSVKISSGLELSRENRCRNYFVGLGLRPIPTEKFKRFELENIWKHCPEWNSCCPNKNCEKCNGRYGKNGEEYGKCSNKTSKFARISQNYYEEIGKHIIFFGVGRPKGESTFEHDKPFYGYIEKVKKKPKYQKIEWMHNFFQRVANQSVVPWVKTANYDNPPLTHQFKLWTGSPIIKFKMNLDNTPFAMKKGDMQRNKHLKKEEHMAMLNLTQKYIYTAMYGNFSGDQITIDKMFISKGEVPLFPPNADEDSRIKITSTFFLPNGTMANQEKEY